MIVNPLPRVEDRNLSVKGNRLVLGSPPASCTLSPMPQIQMQGRNIRYSSRSTTFCVFDHCKVLTTTKFVVQVICVIYEWYWRQMDGKRLLMASRRSVHAQHQRQVIQIRSLRIESFRNMHGHFWGYVRETRRHFHHLRFTEFWNKYQHMDILAKNRIPFMSWITLRSRFRTKLTTMDFRPDEHTEVMRRM